MVAQWWRRKFCDPPWPPPFLFFPFPLSAERSFVECRGTVQRSGSTVDRATTCRWRCDRLTLSQFIQFPRPHQLEYATRRPKFASLRLPLHPTPFPLIANNKTRGTNNHKLRIHGFVANGPNGGPSLVSRRLRSRLHRVQLRNLACATAPRWRFAHDRCAALHRATVSRGDYPAACVRGQERLGNHGDSAYVVSTGGAP